MSEETNPFRDLPKFHEGFIYYLGLSSLWNPGYLILRGNTLLVYKSTNKRDESPRDQIPLNDHTEVEAVVEKGDNKRKFVVRNEKKRGTKFECKTESERDLWVAFIDGIATGFFTKSSNLSKTQIERLESAIETWMMFHTHSNKLSDEGISSDLSFDSSSGFVNEGGPIKNHKFYCENPGRPRYQQPPSWFFENCSRQLAELILEKGRSFGNVLMRQSVTFKGNGSYVLSLRREAPGGSTFEHFEVIQAAAGYKINVENVHSPKKCLQDVIDYFLEVAGLHYTRPLSTNDLVTIGIHRPFYQAVIQPVEPSPHESQRPKSGNARDSKTWSHKQLFADSASVSHAKPISQTISGKSVENPFRQKSCREMAISPASLREVLRCRRRESMDSEDEEGFPAPNPIRLNKTTSTPSLEAEQITSESNSSNETTSRFSKLYSTPRPKQLLKSPVINSRPLPPIPVAPPAAFDSSQNSQASTSQGPSPSVATMSVKQRLSQRLPMAPPAQTASTQPTAHPETQSHQWARENFTSSIPLPPPTGKQQVQNLQGILSPSTTHVSPFPPPPPPLLPPSSLPDAHTVLSPQIPTAPPLAPLGPPRLTSPAAPAVPLPVTPSSPRNIGIPPPPPLDIPPPPPVDIPSPPTCSIPPPPPCGIPPPPPAPMPSSVLTAPSLAKSLVKTQQKKVTIVAPTPTEPPSTATGHKTLPRTKPKPTRRASESDLLNTMPRSVSVPTNSEIVEEEHPPVRDVRAMFDNPSLSTSTNNNQRTPHHKSYDRRHSTLGVGSGKSNVLGSQPVVGKGGIELIATEYANTNANKQVEEPIYEDIGMYQNVGRFDPVSVPAPEVGHPGRALQQLPLAPHEQLPPPPPTLPPPPPPHQHQHPVVPDQSLSSGEGRENFKKRLEALMGGAQPPVTSPVSTNMPMPALPQNSQTANIQRANFQTPLVNQDNIYSEPVNQ